jgi:hypothetical protein
MRTCSWGGLTVRWRLTSGPFRVAGLGCLQTIGGFERFRPVAPQPMPVQRSRLLTGLAGAFAAMTAALAVAGVLYNPAILAPAALFGVVTYFLWMHASGRLAARIYRGVEQRAATNGGRSRRQGPRESNRTRRSRGDRSTRDRGRQARRERTRRTNGGSQVRPEGQSIPKRQACDVLGVDRDADQEQIKAAYRERVKDVHPDAEGGDADAFKRVQDAYDVLTD